MHRKGTVLPRPYPLPDVLGLLEKEGSRVAPASSGGARLVCGLRLDAALSRRRLQRLGKRRRAACKCTQRACCCPFPGISWLGFLLFWVYVFFRFLVLIEGLLLLLFWVGLLGFFCLFVFAVVFCGVLFLFHHHHTHRELLHVLVFLLSPLARFACAVLRLLSAPQPRAPLAAGWQH